MRLWHKDLIAVLPRQQLQGQWRELSAIAGSIQQNGTPNHVLVNKILDYPPSHFKHYAHLIQQELTRRGIRTMSSVINKICLTNWDEFKYDLEATNYSLFYNWHNDRYFEQCYYNLQEKYDCGAITAEEWQKIEEVWEYHG